MSACPDNTRILSGCFRNVVRVLQESCPDISGMLSGCCKNNQFHDNSKKSVNMDNVVVGIRMFVIGLSKKMLLADIFSSVAEYGYSHIGYASSLEIIISILAYSFQIYFDFSGYSDMAIGVSRIFNIDLPINFDSPYKATSFRDFWRRWHISLTMFFKKYVYIPLGGSRKGKIRTIINNMIVFILSGIWHGANWTFILWGGLAWYRNSYRKTHRSLYKQNLYLYELANNI